MNDSKAVEMLRKALIRCNQGIGNVQEAQFALNVTSGKLPEGYSLDPPAVGTTMAGRIYVRYQGEFIIMEGWNKPVHFYDEFEASLWCWTKEVLEREVSPVLEGQDTGTDKTNGDALEDLP